jgi:hypothetical protein
MHLTEATRATKRPAELGIANSQEVFTRGLEILSALMLARECARLPMNASSKNVIDCSVGRMHLLNQLPVLVPLFQQQLANPAF